MSSITVGDLVATPTNDLGTVAHIADNGDATITHLHFATGATYTTFWPVEALKLVKATDLVPLVTEENSHVFLSALRSKVNMRGSMFGPEDARQAVMDYAENQLPQVNPGAPEFPMTDAAVACLVDRVVSTYEFNKGLDDRLAERGNEIVDDAVSDVFRTLFGEDREWHFAVKLGGDFNGRREFLVKVAFDTYEEAKETANKALGMAAREMMDWLPDATRMGDPWWDWGMEIAGYTINLAEKSGDGGDIVICQR